MGNPLTSDLASGPGLSGIEIQGDLSEIADQSVPVIQFTAAPSLVSGAYPNIWIGDSLTNGNTAGAEIVFPTNGITGDIIVNQRFVGGEWDTGASISAGSVVLDEAEYDAIPSTFGGGAVAEAAYTRHAEWSVPEEGGAVIIRAVDPTSILVPPECVAVSPTVKIRMYGFVKKNGSGPAVKVERYAHPNWVDVTDEFDIAAPSVSGREITLQKKTSTGPWSSGSHRVVYDRTLDAQSSGADDAELVCIDIAGNPRIASFTHTFGTTDLCKVELLNTYDLNSDETLSSEDLGAWVADPRDFNDDSAADGADITIHINAINQYTSFD